MSDSKYIWIPLSSLVLAIFFTIAFLTMVIKKFRTIIQLHSTISSYCSDPRGFGNKFLVAITFLVGCNYTTLLLQENSSVEDPKYWNETMMIIQISANTILPLVGIFYTNGYGILNNTYYQFGDYKFPIQWSTFMHSFSALYWMIITITLNIIFATLYENDYYFTLCILSLVIFMMFIVCQALVFFYGIEYQYEAYCDTCANKTPLLKRTTEKYTFTDNTCRVCFRDPTLNQGDPTEFNIGYIRSQAKMTIMNVNNKDPDPKMYQFSAKIFAYSFIFESLTVISAALLAIIGCICRIVY